jgi:hypothetical protein
MSQPPFFQRGSTDASPLCTGIVHLDLAARNVLVTGNERAKVRYE